MANENYVSIYDGHEILVLADGTELFSLQSLSWDTDQKKEVKRGIGRQKRGQAANSGANVIGTSRSPMDISLSMEFLEISSALLEAPLMAQRSGEKVLESFTLNGQTVECLQDLRNLTIVISYPVINGIRRKAYFYGVEFTKDSGGVKIGEAPTRKCDAIATGCKGLV